MATELDSTISVFENLSAPGSFDTDSLGPPILLPTGWNAWGVSAGDLDLDGRPDIVFGNQYDNTVTLYRNEVPLGSAPVIFSQPQGGSFNEGDSVITARSLARAVNASQSESFQPATRFLMSTSQIRRLALCFTKCRQR